MKKVLLFFLLLLMSVVLNAQDSTRLYFIDYLKGDTLREVFFVRGDVQDGISSSPYLDMGYVSEEEARQFTFSNFDLHSVKKGKNSQSGGDKLVLNLLLIPDYFEMGEVILPASISQDQPAPHISKIGKEELQRDQQLSIAPVLNRVPGVFMHMGTLNTSRLTIRGIGARSLFSTTKVKAYIENIPLSTGDGETTIEDLDLPLIDEMTVVRGPASSLFGAGLGGALILRSRHLFSPRQEVNALLQTGAFGLRRASLTAKTSDVNTGLGIHANYLETDGWRDNNSYQRFQASLQGNFVIDSKSRLSILGSILDVKGFIPSSLDSATFASRPSAAAFTWAQTSGNEDYIKGLLGLNYTRELGKVWKIRASLPVSYRANDELRPFNFLRETALAVGNRTVLEGYPRIGGRAVEIFVGEESFHEFYAWQTYENIGGIGNRGGQLSDNREERRYINAFAQASIPLNKRLQLSLGSNFNKTWYDYEDFFFGDSVDLSGSYEFDGIFSPRLALSYQINEGSQLHVQLSHGFSPPLLSETLTPEGQINPDIQPETGWNYEVGVEGTEKLLGSLGFFYSLSAYYLDAQNLLLPRRVDNDQFVGVNAGRSRHLGVETEFRLSGREREAFRFEIWGQYTYMDHRFVDFLDEEASQRFDGNRLPGIPAYNASAGIDLIQNFQLFSKSSRAKFQLNGQFVGKMPLRDDNVLFSQPYQVLNAKIQLERKVFSSWSSLAFGIQNMLDVRYASMILVNAGSFGGRAPRYFYPGMPRNIFVELNLGISRQ